jgi:single-strand DNA-binding protein
MLPQITIEGRVVADPELRFAPSGVAVGSFRIAASSRKKDEQGQWQDDKRLFMSVTCFRQLGENVAESLRQGDLVVVTGRINTDEWQDAQSGEKRSQIRMLADNVAVSLMFRSVDRHGIPERRQSGDSGPDPWATPEPASPVGRGQPEDPPF